MSAPPALPERPGASPTHMNIDRELLKLMRPGRIGGNRRCADCDAELTDYGNIWASVDQGCFVCVNCVSVHRSLGFRTKSVNMDFWAVDEVARMTSMGNVKVNEILERYVPGSWTKPTPDADQHQREHWIMAKYSHTYFMLPHYREEGVDATRYQSPASVSQTMPIRLVDYFVVVGPGGVNLHDRLTPESLPGDIEFREEVLDCFPEADSHLGYPLPEHLPQFVYPDGMRLCSHETAPTTFAFVLTNSCGLKMHGAVLHVTEEMDPRHLGGMVSKALSSSGAEGAGAGGQQQQQRPRTGAALTPAQLPTWLRDTMATPERTGGHDRSRVKAGCQPTPLYAPKALVLLSHYPFYNIYTQFLQQIYRIGLSEAPLPIERYISNFVCEVPLPPQGQVEVNYALPDRTLTITRPPRNRLPLVDFSYRPLFASLSVENILCVVGLLLTEAKVALCAAHYSLLAPCAEGLLSLLFPFVWQGAYIPVMPFNMKDVLEAPVPFLVGIHSRYLMEMSSDKRPEGVVFVDLDNDKIFLGLDEDMGAPRRRPHLPEREASKLRQKLNETKSAGLMARVTSQRKASKRRNPAKNAGLTVRFGTQESASILDPANHTNSPDGFSAAEIRAAFLRFFVSIFRGYLAHVIMPSNNTPYPEKLFQKEAFLKSCGHLPESSHVFMSAFLDSQMFERFLEERTATPTPPEVRFFDESIAAKLNRSKTNPIKKDTPFLNDLSDAHNQVFNPPAPSNWGLPDDGSQYAYGLSFPRLNKDRYGTVRWAKRLFKTPDQHRNVSSVNHQRLLSGARWGGGGSTSRRGSRAGSVLVAKRAHSHMRKETESVVKGLVCLQALYRMHMGKTSFKAKKEAAAVISRFWLNGQATIKDRSMLYSIITLVKDIQRVYRGHLARRGSATRLRSVCKLQAWQRMLVLRRRWKRMQAAAIVLQSLARQLNCRHAFMVVRELIILAQAAVRGWIERRIAAKERKIRLAELRAQVFELWIRAFTPLVYRSKFWVLFQGGAFLDLAIHEDEALRLWRDLGLIEHQKEHLARVHFNQTFSYVTEWLRTTRPAGVTVSPMTTGNGIASCTSSPGSNAAEDLSMAGAAVAAAAAAAAAAAVAGGSGGAGAPGAASSGPAGSLRSRVLRHNSVTGAMRKLGNGANLGLTSGMLATLGLSSLRRGSSTATPSPMGSARGGLGGQPGAVARQAAERLVEERERLYFELKKETQGGTRVSLFSLFGLEKQKKRKRKLVGVLWCELRLADASAEVVLSVFRDHMEARHAWVENKRDARVRADLLCTVQACILSLQRLRHQTPNEGRQIIRASALASLPSSLSIIGGAGGGSVVGGPRSVGSPSSRPASWKG